MGTVTASLERSLQNCSLNQTRSSSRIRRGIAGSSSSSSEESSDIVNQQQQQQHDDDNDNDDYVGGGGGAAANASSSDDNCTLIQLNSHISLPYHWEQCLDLKTGELYYINWRSGKKVKEDPRTTATGYNGDYDSDDETDNDESESETEKSSTESSCWSSQESYRSAKKREQQVRQAAVLVVAGCKTCLMYHMVPKHVDQCPKCCGHLLHFAANNSS